MNKDKNINKDSKDNENKDNESKNSKDDININIPIVATAKKVDTVGDKDILEIEIPLEEDKKIVKKVTQDINNVLKELKSNGGKKEMNEAELEKVLNEKLGKMKLEETIHEIHENTMKLSEKINNIESTVNILKERHEETCTGVECLKKDIQTVKSVDKKVDETKNMVDLKLKEIEQKIGGLKKKVGICAGEDGCNAEIPVGASYCPNCGKQIEGWKGLPDWVPYSKRKK